MITYVRTLVPCSFFDRNCLTPRFSFSNRPHDYVRTYSSPMLLFRQELSHASLQLFEFKLSHAFHFNIQKGRLPYHVARVPFEREERGTSRSLLESSRRRWRSTSPKKHGTSGERWAKSSDQVDGRQERVVTTAGYPAHPLARVRLQD
jgi:hypothetical protein